MSVRQWAPESFWVRRKLLTARKDLSGHRSPLQVGISEHKTGMRPDTRPQACYRMAAIDQDHLHWVYTYEHEEGFWNFTMGLVDLQFVMGVEGARIRDKRFASGYADTRIGITQRSPCTSEGFTDRLSLSRERSRRGILEFFNNFSIVKATTRFSPAELFNLPIGTISSSKVSL